VSSRLKVLIVDDDQISCLAVRQSLRESPLEVDVLEADSVAAAKEHLKRRDLDCLLLDYRLPGETGLVLLQAIREEEAVHQLDGGLPIIFLTAQGDETVAVAAMKAGATDYIPKSDLSQDRLSSAIRTGVEIHRRRGEVLQAHAKLRRAHDQLEGRVQKRTADIEQVNEALRRRNAELDEFTYVASHDLQEPLRKLVAFSDLLPRDLNCELPEQAKRDLDFITEAAKRMQALVQDLLALSRAGNAAMKRAPVSLQESVERAVETLSTRIEETGAVIVRDELPTVVGDRAMLARLYQNLIGNALKFIKPGQPPAIRLTVEKHDRKWILGVCDNGIGIKPEYAGQIFAPFKRLHGRNEYEGTGIGLAICRKIVERHGGQIWVESELDQGAHFRFTLKRSEAVECRSESENLQLCC